jgi:hypothetical protein
MSPEMAEIAIGEFLKAIRGRLEQAASIAKAAEACAEAGNPEKGVGVVLDVEQLIYEATSRLLKLSRLHRGTRRSIARPLCGA